MIRIIIGVVIAVALGMGVVMAGDWLNHRFFPPPPDVQITNPEAIRDYMQHAPITSLLGLPVTWTLAALISAFAAARVGARRWVGWIAGGLMCAATAANLIMIPHPLWMAIAAAICVPGATWLGAKLGTPAVA